MLTGVVNIAVFAAFQRRVGGCEGSKAELKGMCGMRQLAASRYGRQKRQDVATDVATKDCQVRWDGCRVYGMSGRGRGRARGRARARARAARDTARQQRMRWMR